MKVRLLLPASLVAAILLSACSDAPTSVAPIPDATASPSVSAALGAAGAADLSDGRGTAWRQITETVGLSWNQLAQACPRDGGNPCTGVVAGRDLSGWVWATDSQVVELLARYEPAIRGGRVLQGPAYDASVAAFFRAFTPTNSGGCSGTGYVITCSFGAFLSGWTSTSDYAGAGIQATVQSGFFAPSMFQITADANVAASSSSRGAFLWRADGSGGTAIVATDDNGAVDSPTGGVAVANVLANDSLAGATATLATVTIRQLSSTHPGVSLNASTGAVSVAYGVPAGLPSLTYRICETARPANCDDAAVAITVRGNIVDAVDDAGVAKTGGGIAIVNVLANDTFAGGPATRSNVTIAQVGTDPRLTLQPDGSLRIAAGTPAGAYSAVYRICEIGNPTNCDDATVRVTVTAYAIDAVEDEGYAQSGPGGTPIANVLANDTFDGAIATLVTTTVSQLSSTTAGLSLDAGTGAVKVAPGTPAGSHTLRYRLCETASPANCDETNVRVNVAPQSYMISSNRHSVLEGKGGSFTVRLSQVPASNVSVSVAYLAGTMAVTSSPAVLTFTVSNWNLPQTVTYSTNRDSDKIDNAGTLLISAAGIANALVVINGSDGDRKATDPLPVIQAPYNGQSVSGAVSFWGTATDSDGSIADVKFYVDGNRIATVTGSAGTYRPPLWVSSTVANGWHTLEIRGTDNLGNSGRATLSVYVQN